MQGCWSPSSPSSRDRIQCSRHAGVFGLLRSRPDLIPKYTCELVMMKGLFRFGVGCPTQTTSGFKPNQSFVSKNSCFEYGVYEAVYTGLMLTSALRQYFNDCAGGQSFWILPRHVTSVQRVEIASSQSSSTPDYSLRRRHPRAPGV